ncbi:MAG TPA: hypothetical protein VF188_18935 [Longimicrobiales bacterium]
MRITASSAVLLAMLSAVAPGSVHAQARPDQHALARDLAHGNAGERGHALAIARQMPPESIRPELRSALIAELERAASLRKEARRRGVFLTELIDPEYALGLSSVVADLGDPRAIPGLVGSLGAGYKVCRALAMFGEQAAPLVLDAVRSLEETAQIDDALLVLRFMVEGAAGQPLSAATLQQIRSVADRRLTGRQHVTTLWNAMDLAMALNDSGLQQIVEALASDRGEVIARGVTEPDLIEKTQKLARDRLAGVPPLPRWN